ncbi:hypothetical protein CPB85DRAFT_839604 [Mucidula mucida]|nr:hypothetical protein CPB85DRAFT_839604 [Mucidula mucida]
MHKLLMKSCRVLPLQSYVNIGCTRSFSRKTVVIKGSFHTECCPFAEVDNEMEYICRMARQYIRNWRNPFGTSSWLHFVFARCHPFEDGNGRMARLLASIPLIRRAIRRSA